MTSSTLQWHLMMKFQQERERAILAYQGEYGYFPDSTYIDACVIDKDYRGQGIGSKLMKFFDKKAKEAGIKTIVFMSTRTTRMLKDFMKQERLINRLEQ